jgi:hypothetical protein
VQINVSIPSLVCTGSGRRTDIPQPAWQGSSLSVRRPLTFVEAPTFRLGVAYDLQRATLTSVARRTVGDRALPVVAAKLLYEIPGAQFQTAFRRPMKISLYRHHTRILRSFCSTARRYSHVAVRKPPDEGHLQQDRCRHKYEEILSRNDVFEIHRCAIYITMIVRRSTIQPT